MKAMTIQFNLVGGLRCIRLKCRLVAEGATRHMHADADVNAADGSLSCCPWPINDISACFASSEAMQTRNVSPAPVSFRKVPGVHMVVKPATAGSKTGRYHELRYIRECWHAQSKAFARITLVSIVISRASTSQDCTYYDARIVELQLCHGPSSTCIRTTNTGHCAFDISKQVCHDIT